MHQYDSNTFLPTIEALNCHFIVELITFLSSFIYWSCCLFRPLACSVALSLQSDMGDANQMRRQKVAIHDDSALLEEKHYRGSFLIYFFIYASKEANN